jgi:hypothetical protein
LPFALDACYYVLPVDQRIGFFFLLAARMLSTRLGRLRPAFFAECLAAAFLAGDSVFDFLPFLRGLAFFRVVYENQPFLLENSGTQIIIGLVHLTFGACILMARASVVAAERTSCCMAS